MAFSRVSSSLLRRTPFTSKFISSSSSSSSVISISNNFTTTISKFHFSNPRNTDFLQVRKYIGEASGYDVETLRAELKLKLNEADDAIDLALESKHCFILWPDYKNKAKRGNDALNIALEIYNRLMSKLDEDEKEVFGKSFDGRWVEGIQECRDKMMNDELMQHDLKHEDVLNYIKLLQKQNGYIPRKEGHNGSGGYMSREEEHKGSGGYISREEEHKGSGGDAC